MKALLSIERRMQDLERKFENKERLGKIVDTKFENNRWYVKLNDGEDDTPSGSKSSADPIKGEGTFKSDWQPWKSFSHGTIKMSVPPKKGQYALMRAAGGIPELSVVEPHHYGPENPSPHDKHDEIVHLIEDEDEDGNSQQSGSNSSGTGQDGQSEDKWNNWVHQTKNMHHLIIRKKDQQQSSDSSSTTSTGSGNKQQKRPRKTRKLPEVAEEGDDKTTQIKSTNEFILKTVGKNKSYYRQDGDKVHLRFGEDGAKADVLMDENQVKIQFKDKKAVVKWTESDLNVTFGEDKANIKLDDSAIVLTQGKDKASVTIQEDYVEVKGASECSAGVNGRWVYINGSRVNLGVTGPKEMADKRVMTESGPSQVVWAKIS